MKDSRDNVVKFQPRRPEPPKRPKPQKAWLQPGPKPFQANRYGAPEPAIRWRKAPKALVLIALMVLAMALLGGLGDWIASIGR